MICSRMPSKPRIQRNGQHIGVRTGSPAAAASPWKSGTTARGFPGDPGARFRSLLYHQAARCGHRFRAGDCAGFVRQHGGTVALVSPPTGARFVVELPVPPVAGIHDDEQVLMAQKNSR